jgi:uncharacterized protein (UPF0548 family)
MITYRPPTPQELQQHLASWQEAPLSYPHREGVENPPFEDFIDDEHRVLLGQGEEVYQRACAALDAWCMFPPWAVVHPLGAPQKPGQVVAMVTQICGLWWINPCRVLHRCDSLHRHGFVYGTLPEHTECGEERFMVQHLPDGSVWYEIRAFSRPRHWMAWLGFPLAPWWQLRFVRDSQTLMKRMCA